MDFLWLGEEEVRSLLTMDEAIKAVESAFVEHGMGKTQMPPKSYLFFSKYEGDLRSMPAYLEGLDAAGVKIVNFHNKNSARGLPTVMALVVLNSPETGAPLAVMGGTFLTNMRTGAAGAIAARALARSESSVVGMVGAGAQARTQLLGISRLFSIKRVIVCDRTLERCQALERYARPFLDCEYNLTTNPQEACSCDILVTTTPSRSPLIKESWARPGIHINAIGADAPGKQELASSLTRKAKVVVDDLSQALHSGEVNVPISEGIMTSEDIHAQLGEVMLRKAPGRTSQEEITIFDSTGLGIQDVAAGSVVYRKALETGRGTRLAFL
jgi:alanine dehydrogenase